MEGGTATAAPVDGGGRRGVRRPLSAAPMMGRTDRHFRYFLRRITRRTLLYSEMVTTGAVLRGLRPRLEYDPEENPLALQLGGDDPRALAASARIAAELGYDEVNLNVGCPSDRVQKGRFGACLMAEPQRVADAVAAMRAAVPLPVTVKHRIGIDDRDRYDDLAGFVAAVAAAGCDRFIVHARKAWLRGLSARQNRAVPPLRYDDVYRLKDEHPQLAIEINGGIRSVTEAERHLERVDGAMIGRAAYDDPFLFATADARLFGDGSPPPTRREVIAGMIPYMERWRESGLPLVRITRHLLGLFAGQPGTRAWKRHLSEEARPAAARVEVVREALRRVPDEVLDLRPEPDPR